MTREIESAGEYAKVKKRVCTTVSEECRADLADLERGVAFAELGVDSLAMLGVVARLEEYFEVSMTIDEIGDVQTCADLARGIADKLVSRHESRAVRGSDGS